MPLTNPIIQIHKILRSIIWPYNQHSQNPPENNKPKQTLYSIITKIHRILLDLPKKYKKKCKKEIQTFQQKLWHTYIPHKGLFG
jgi:hypothetical protein